MFLPSFTGVTLKRKISDTVSDPQIISHRCLTPLPMSPAQLQVRMWGVRKGACSKFWHAATKSEMDKEQKLALNAYLPFVPHLFSKRS